MISSAFVLGLLGSFHCVGMCGPIALALPVNQHSRFTAGTGVLLYNLGRVTTYALLGLIFGIVGHLISMAGFQRWVSIAVGVGMILVVLTPRLFQQFSLFDQVGSSISVWMQSTFKQLMKSNSNTTLFMIGLVNGFLPCGFVYIGIAGAITTGNLFYSALYMALFGLGTLPIMAAVTIFGKTISLRVRTKVQKAVPYMMVALGILFILRGLALGIPFLSPPAGIDQPGGMSNMNHTATLSTPSEMICH